MKTLQKFAIFIMSLVLTLPTALTAKEHFPVGIVDMSKVMQDSKYGQYEVEVFKDIKTQIETLIKDAEKALSEDSKKLQDQDYMDGLSPQAEKDLNQKVKTKQQELMRYYQQYNPTLEQANMQMQQRMLAYVKNATTTIAKESGQLLILEKNSIYFGDTSLDVTKRVIEILDQDYKKNPPKKQKK